MVKVTLVLLRSEGWKDAVVKVTLGGGFEFYESLGYCC